MVGGGGSELSTLNFNNQLNKEAKGGGQLLD